MNLDCVSEIRLKRKDIILGSLNLNYEGEGKIRDVPRFGGWNVLSER